MISRIEVISVGAFSFLAMRSAARLPAQFPVLTGLNRGNCRNDIHGMPLNLEPTCRWQYDDGKSAGRRDSAGFADSDQW